MALSASRLNQTPDADPAPIAAGVETMRDLCSAPLCLRLPDCAWPTR
ncbi:MAG: hypothetical protein AVDCRST_MAG71-2481 [uncultured Lysobacter sp.]|uniref:Uncharacterized protein n=1 Tax=uncultured Lysobacter sp. TaxID=271060 RepID=A0A6J4M0S9_9GAMM|nr:MAG: hypothetical protein AVDCRST_MAG71-2481 [uncultured Lysobacter sp.]